MTTLQRDLLYALIEKNDLIAEYYNRIEEVSKECKELEAALTAIMPSDWSISDDIPELNYYMC